MGHHPPKSLGWKHFCTFPSSLSLDCQHEINIHFVLTAALASTSPSCSHFYCLSFGCQCFMPSYFMLPFWIEPCLFCLPVSSVCTRSQTLTHFYKAFNNSSLQNKTQILCPDIQVPSSAWFSNRKMNK